MIFPHVYLNFTDQKTISSSFYHPIRVMSSDSFYDLSTSSWYSTRTKMHSFCTPARVAINNHSKSFPIIQNDLWLIEMYSSHSKTGMKLLALRPLHRFDHGCCQEISSLLQMCCKKYDLGLISDFHSFL